jgi:hypothetical protein
MKQTLQGKKKHEVVDSESFFLIKLIQEALLFDCDSNMGAIEYLEKYDRFIRATGRVLERLGLAESDERRGIGWKATRRLISLIADRGVRPLKGTKNRASYTDRALLDLLVVAAEMDGDGYGGGFFAVEVLEALGLLRRDGFEGWEPMPLLAQLLVEASELKSYN